MHFGSALTEPHYAFIKTSADQLLNKFWRFFKGDGGFIKKLRELLFPCVGHDAFIKSANRVCGHLPTVALIFDFLLQQSKHHCPSLTVDVLNATRILRRIFKVGALRKELHNFHVGINLPLDLSVEFEKELIIIGNGSIALLRLHDLGRNIFGIEFHINSAIKLKCSPFFFHSEFSLHCLENKITETPIVTAVNEEPEFSLKVCPAQNAL